MVKRSLIILMAVIFLLMLLPVTTEAMDKRALNGNNYLEYNPLECYRNYFSGDCHNMLADNNEVSYSEKDIKIAFMRDGDIWVINGDGTGETRVTASGDCYKPQWSPDGKKIAYSRTYMVSGYGNHQTNDETRNQIWIMDFTTGKDYKLSTGFDQSLWISDNEIIFLKAENVYNVFITRKNLLTNEEFKINALGSMDSTSLFLEGISLKDELIFYGFVHGRGGFVSIVDFDGNDIKRPNRGEKYGGEAVADYNESSNCLLLSVNSGMKTGYGPIYDLCIINLTENKSVYYENFYDGKWTPDGKYIICVTRDNNIVKGHSGGTALTTSGDVVSIADVSDKMIFYVRKSGKIDEYKDSDAYYLWSIGLDGSSPERITEGDFSRWGGNVDVWYPGK